MVLKFSLRRLTRHWRLNLAVLLGLTLASALLAGLPSFAATIAMQSLRQSLADEHPAARNIQVEGTSLNAALYNSFSDNLGDLLISRLVVRNTIFNVDPKEPVISIDGTERRVPQQISVWSFDKLGENMRLIEGEWPEFFEPHTQSEVQRMMFQIEIDAAIDQETASQLGLKIGDRLLTNLPYEFIIVGIIERNNPQGEIWWGDPTPFEPTFRPGINEDTIIVPIIIVQRSMTEYLSDNLVTWRLLLDRDFIIAENAQHIEEKLIQLKSKVLADRASMTTNLPNILLEYRENLTMTRTVLFLLSIQAFLFILFALSLIDSLLLERSRGEIATLAGRGASKLQITRIFATEGFLMAAIAGGIAGPMLAVITLHIWSFISGEIVPLGLSTEAWLYSIIGAGFGWFVLVFTTYTAARRSVVEWQRQRARPERLSRWQRNYLDLFLFAFGILTFWQLMNTKSFVLRQAEGTIFTDPLLLLSPTLLLIAIALLFLRIFPYLLSLFARLVRSSRRLILPLGVARLSRDPMLSSRVVLLISIATGLAMFAVSFEDSLRNSQIEIAKYLAGADFRVKQLNHSLAEFSEIPGVLDVSPVFRSAISGTDGRLTTILAVDTQTFGRVAAHYPQGMTYLTIDTVLAGLQWGASQTEETPKNAETNPYFKNIDDGNAVTAMFSSTALESGKTVGDRQQVKLAIGNQPTFEIRGLIINFPTVSNAFILVDRTELQSVLDLEDHSFYDNKEVWLSVDPEYYASLVANPLLDNKTLADAQKELHTIQNNAFIEGSRRAFLLNAFIIAVLSIAVFALASYFSARQRVYELGILRALGLSKGDVFRLLAGESFLVIFLGFIGGTGIGYTLAQVMRPYINLVLTKVMPNTVVYDIVVDWQSVVILYGILMIFFTLATLVALAALLRTGIHRVMRIGEE